MPRDAQKAAVVGSVVSTTVFGTAIVLLYVDHRRHRPLDAEQLSRLVQKVYRSKEAIFYPTGDMKGLAITRVDVVKVLKPHRKDSIAGLMALDALIRDRAGERTVT